MNVLILGAGGIVGQNMRLRQPVNIKAVYTRKTPWVFYEGLRFRDSDETVGPTLDLFGKVDVVVNLVGENRPDVVEKDPGATSSSTLSSRLCSGSGAA